MQESISVHFWTIRLPTGIRTVSWTDIRSITANIICRAMNCTIVPGKQLFCAYYRASGRARQPPAFSGISDYEADADKASSESASYIYAVFTRDAILASSWEPGLLYEGEETGGERDASFHAFDCAGLLCRADCPGTVLPDFILRASCDAYIASGGVLC